MRDEDPRRWLKFVVTMMGLHPRLALLATLCLSLTLITIAALVRYNSIDWCRNAVVGRSDRNRALAARQLANDFSPHLLQKAVPELLWVIQTERTHVADLCADALGRLDAQTKREVLPHLVRIIEYQKNSSYYYSAAPEAMGNMGEDAVPFLVAWLMDSHPYYRDVAERGLKQLRWSPRTDEERAWWLATQGEWQQLVRLGTPAIPVVSDRLLAKKRCHSEEREIVKALRGSGHDCVPLLKAMASIDSCPRLSSLGASILADIARSHQEALDTLAAILPSVSPDIQEQLVAGLGAGSSEIAKAMLYSLLDDPSTVSRQTVAAALWRSGAFDNLRNPAAAQQIPKPLKFVVLANDPSWDLTTALPEEWRSTTLRQATIIILVEYHVEKSSIWYWRGAGAAKEGRVTVKIIDRVQNVLRVRSFSGGVVGYSGTLDEGGVGFIYNSWGSPCELVQAVPYSHSKHRAEVISWLRGSLEN